MTRSRRVRDVGTDGPTLNHLCGFGHAHLKLTGRFAGLWITPSVDASPLLARAQLLAVQVSRVSRPLALRPRRCTAQRGTPLTSPCSPLIMTPCARDYSTTALRSASRASE